jgi:DNA-directed RNA polymerase specialized sigma24 family protein
LSQEARAALAQLSDDALQALILELGRYALSVSRRLYWRTGNAVDLPRGETVDSIVSKAFTKVLTGERRWNPQTAPDLQKYLMGVIDSLLNHLAQHKDNTTLRAVPRLSDGRDAPLSPAPGATAWHQQPPDPESALLQHEQAAYEDRVLQHLLGVSEDDPLVTQIIQAMQDGHDKPSEVATALGVPVSDVYNAMKRLDRKMMGVRQTLQEK